MKTNLSNQKMYYKHFGVERPSHSEQDVYRTLGML